MTFSSEQMYKLFPSMRAPMTKKDLDDKREPRLDQVVPDTVSQVDGEGDNGPHHVLTSFPIKPKH